HMKDAMAIFGSGRAAALLAFIPWLKASQIFYWGDIDAEGFEILDNLLSVFPGASSFCMDFETLDTYRKETTTGSNAAVKNLPHLNDKERLAYQFVVQHNLRLEQEQVHPDWVQSCLQSLL
ncbi:MAG: DUF2220 domain-containing protein, partial [Chitinophagaceae bacterium]|nr:DUF2220 domain-containing protein [Chitinophagaceae bacterium]